MGDNFEDNITKQYDEELESAMKKEDGLCWLPWIGKDYPRQNVKLLLVGESHYTEEAPDSVKGNKDFTRKVIDDFCICRKFSTTTFTNINWALVGCNDFEGKLIWNKISFYNFIQRPMEIKDDRRPERPDGGDFADGWQNFIDVVKIIKPTVCIFAGNKAANYFNESMSNLKILHTKVEFPKYINSVWVRKSTVTIDNSKTVIHFIKHPAWYFSWKTWHKYLDEQDEQTHKTISFLMQQLSGPSSADQKSPKATPENV